ncbi:MAG: hypothetical protein Fur0014_13450 [Rubrivivax sp.]
MPSPIIPDRAEFVEALRLLRRGHLMVHLGDGANTKAIGGGIVHHSAPALMQYGLVDEVDNPDGFPGVRYYRLSERGREFADRAWARWRSLPLLERAAVRLFG